MPNNITVQLSPEDAELFKVFCEHYDTFSLFLERGVFNVKNGSVVMDFDKDSVLQTIRFTGFMYSRKHEMLTFPNPHGYYSL